MLSQLRTLRADYEENIKSYKDLFALKIDLDQELAAYKAMLKGEEGRCVLHSHWQLLSSRPIGCLARYLPSLRL